MAERDDFNDGIDVTKDNSAPEFECQWLKQEYFNTASAKKAVSAAMFLLFLGYTLLVFLRHKNRDKALGVKLHRLVNEFAYAHLFFFIAAILVHVLTPKEFPVLLIYLYIISMATQVFAQILEKSMLNKIVYFI